MLASICTLLELSRFSLVQTCAMFDAFFCQDLLFAALCDMLLFHWLSNTLSCWTRNPWNLVPSFHPTKRHEKFSGALSK